MSTLNLPLTREQDSRLRQDAQAVGMSPTDYALRRLLAEEEPLGLFTAMASEDVLAGIWDTPEEDEAWQHLQPAK